MRQHSSHSQHCVSVNECAPNWIAIPTPEIIQPSLFVVDVATIAERIELAQRACHGAGAANGTAPRIIHIADNHRACAIQNGNNVPLQVLHSNNG